MRILFLATWCFIGVIPAMAEPSLRDPFWPVGYVPDGQQEAPVVEDSPLSFDDLSPEDQALIRANMNVSGLMRHGDGYIAFINGVVVRQDDIVPLTVGSKSFRFLVREISEDTINLEPLRDRVEEVSKPKPSPGGKE